VPQINEAGLALIKSFEGLQLHAYRDSVGVLTIGWGHTGPDVTPGLTITEAQAEALLENDLRGAEADVQRLVKPQLTPNQFAALVSLVFNVGPGCLHGTHLAADVNASNWHQAADDFLAYDHAGGVVLAGLLRRRQAERKLFLTV
jgi:lysozyme